MAPTNQKHLLRHKIQVLYEQGTSIRAIVKKLKVSRNTVRKWVLIDRVQTKWDSMPQEFLAACIESFPTRIMACLEADVGDTKY